MSLPSHKSHVSCGIFTCFGSRTLEKVHIEHAYIFVELKAAPKPVKT